MSSKKVDVWDVVAVPIFWILMGVLHVKAWAGLIWTRLRSKPSPELEL